MSNGVAVYVTDVIPNAQGETVIYGLPENRDSGVKVGDVFTLRYEISSEDARQGVLNPTRLNVKEVSLRITKIEMYRGQDVAELHGRTGATGALYLSGTGLEEVTPKCLLQT